MPAEEVDTLLADARQEVSYLDFDAAAILYDRVLSRVEPSTEHWQTATFGRAVCAQQIMPFTAERLALAERLYRTLIERTPDSRYAARAKMHLARLAETEDFDGDRADLDAARQWYEHVIESHPEELVADEATMRLASIAIRTYEPETMRDGVERLEAWLEQRPDNPLASAMHLYRAETYRWLEEYDRAVEAMVRADELGIVGDANLTAQYWFIARACETILMLDADDEQRRAYWRSLAVRYYRKMILDTWVGGKAYESQLALRRLGAPVPAIPGQEPTGLETAPARRATPSPSSPHVRGEEVRP